MFVNVNAFANMFVNLFLYFKNSINRVFSAVCKGVLLRTDDNSAELKPRAVIALYILFLNMID